MLLRFGTSNHGSIRDYQELQLTASSLKDSEFGLIPIGDTDSDSSNTPRKQLTLVPVVALYGANASGKSTILNAFDFLVSSILFSHSGVNTGVGTPHHPFLLDDASTRNPSRYDVDFALDGMRYHYGFELDGKIINSEWLFSFPLNGARQVRSVLFHRDPTADDVYHFGKGLKGDNRRIARMTRDNTLFISSAAQHAHPQISTIVKFFATKISKRLDSETTSAKISKQMYSYFSEDTEVRKKALAFMCAADVGISEISFSETRMGEKVKLLYEDFEAVLEKHFADKEFSLEDEIDKYKAELLHLGESGKKYPIKLENESSGTRALLQLLGPVFEKLEHGGILVVDELNICLHPLVSKELLRLFSDPKINIGKAQLIFTTHDTSMLVTGLLRRDQIWFVEKDDVGSTTLYPLSAIRIRGSDNFEKGYVEGRFGAVPLFGLRSTDFSKLGRATELLEESER